jgi:uncharacterized tellurite resistance protein B-like protein
MSKRKLPKGQSKIQEALTPEEAIAAIGAFTMAADGDVQDVEAETLATVLKDTIDIFESYEDEDVESVCNRVSSLFEEESGEAVLNSALDALPNQDLREAAMYIVFAVLASDGEIPDEESDFADGMRVRLRITAERYNEMIDEVFGDEEDDEEEEDDEGEEE